MRHPASTHNGSALVWTVLIVSILSFVAAEMLQIISGKYHTTLQTAVWQEALLAAETGVDLAIAQLNKSLDPQPNHAWDGWASAPANGVISHSKKEIPNSGLAGTPMIADVNVDAPAQLLDPQNNWQYYRIKATGTMPLTGVSRAAENARDTDLRKLTLRWDRYSGDAVDPNTPGQGQRVSRRVEAIVKPKSAFDQAIMSVGALDLNDLDIVIDSYDSRDPRKSTAVLNPDGSVIPGLYDPAERQQHGNIATDGLVINAGNAHVYGDVATNKGTVNQVANVTGLVRDDFYEAPQTVLPPPWYGTGSINPTPSIVTTNTPLVAGSAQPAATPYPRGGIPAIPNARYVLSSITLSGQDTLTMKNPTPGSTTYIEVYVTGPVSVTGQGSILLEPGVKATLYFGGNVSIAGNGVTNTDNQPGNLLMYGVTPPTGTTRTFALGGNALLSAAVYAPDFDVQVNNGGTHGSAYGSFVGKTVKMVGVTDLHYDEALGAGGLITNYKIVSWFEDNRVVRFTDTR